MEDEKKVSTVGSEEAGYLFQFKEDGVFLTVYPSGDSGLLFELSDMRQILKEYGVLDYDIELLARTVREAAGTPQKLADHFEASVTSELALPDGVKAEGELPDKREFAAFKVDVSKDRLMATIHFEVKANTKPPTEEMVLSALQAKHVVFGIDQEAIQRCVPEMTDFTAAKGTPPVKGEDAQIVRKFNLGDKGRPVKNKFDQVDYKNLKLFHLVKKGELLVERIPHTLGTPGTDVHGDEVPAKPGKPKPLPVGKNTAADGENRLIATMEGQIVDNGSRINIDPQLSISGDVGVSTGNINFTGAVQISGSVQAGFTVKATGDVEIKGMVSGATIEAANVYVSGGIQGMNRGKIKAQKDVRASFAENADIEAGGNIYITDVSLHSELRAGKMVIVEGKRGLVTGGFLAAGEEVRAKIIGNLMNVSTKITVGVNPMLQRKYQETCREYAEAKKKLSQLTKALNTLGKIDMSKLPPNRVEQISAMTRSQFPLAGLIERNEAAIHKMEAEMDAMKKGRVRVGEVMYPGVKLTINSVMKNVQTEEKHCTLSVEEDFVKTGPY